MPTEFEKHCWAEIDLDALKSNYALVKENAGEAAVCAVVKADAYGHGDIMVAKTLSRQGAEWFAVSCLAEAKRLRKAGLKENILILGYTEPSFAQKLVKYNITQSVFSLEYAHALSKAMGNNGKKQPLKCHLKVDTGMGRIGFDARGDLEEAIRQMEECYRLDGLEITGLFQHFAVADSVEEDDLAYSEQQKDLFMHVVLRLEELGHHIPSAHCCNSAGQILHKDWHLDMVRAGIILYGHNPSGDVPVAGLKPVLTLKTVVSQVKQLTPGESISYGRIYTAEKPVTVATLCCGYADGYPRLLSNVGITAVHGKPAPVIGRVCMDQMLIDVTDIPGVKCGDEVSVFGGSGPQDSVTAAAEKSGTICYELLCGLSHRVQKLYIDGGKPIEVLDRMVQ